MTKGRIALGGGLFSILGVGAVFFFMTVWSASGHLHVSSQAALKGVATLQMGSSKSSFFGSSGKLLTIDYQATVRGGTVMIKVTHGRRTVTNDTVIKRETVQRSGRGQLQLTLPESGMYSILIEPWGLDGTLDLDWKQQDAGGR